jgi:hypothetical protein
MGSDSVAGRLVALVASPGRLMEAVALRPRWLVAGLLLVLVVALYSAATLHISAPEQLELMRDSRIMSVLSEEGWQQQYAEALDPTPLKRLTSGLGAGVSSWVMTLVFGGILGLFARLSGGTGSVKQTVGVVGWAALIPFGIGSLLKLPLVLLQETSVRVSLGLAAFTPGLAADSFAYQALVTYGDFSSWWGLAVIAVGLIKVHGLARGSATTITLLTWLLLITVPFVVGRLFM